jgi:hypothetical protein
MNSMVFGTLYAASFTNSNHLASSSDKIPLSLATIKAFGASPNM